MSNLRDFVLETYESLRLEIEDGEWVDAIVTSAKRTSTGNCLVLVDAKRPDGKRTLLIYKEWEDYDSWKSVLEQMQL